MAKICPQAANRTLIIIFFRIFLAWTAAISLCAKPTCQESSCSSGYMDIPNGYTVLPGNHHVKLVISSFFVSLAMKSIGQSLTLWPSHYRIPRSGLHLAGVGIRRSDCPCLGCRVRDILGCD